MFDGLANVCSKFKQMLLYIFLVTLTIISCLICNGKRKREIIISFFLLFFLAIMCGLRGLNCGTDNINYLHIFKYKDYDTSTEYGFVSSFYLIRNFHLWLFLYAIATYALIFKILKDEVNYMTLGILIFIVSTSKFFPETFNVIRQALAAPLILLGFINWNKDKKLKAVGFILLAMLFHTSSVIAFPFLLLRKVHFNFWIVVPALIITYVLGARHIINDTLQLFTFGLSAFSNSESIGEIAQKYSTYGTQDVRTNANAMLMNTLPICLLCALSYPFSRQAKDRYSFYYSIFFITTLIGNLFIPAMEYGFRLVFSLQFIQIIVVPLAYQYSNKIRRQMFWGLFVLLSLIFLYYMKLSMVIGIRPPIPYKMIDDFQIVIDSFIP